MRLLVVEDDPKLAELLARTLREQSYAVDVEGDGEEALYRASVNPYDAIVLDVTLPRGAADSMSVASCAPAARASRC